VTERIYYDQCYLTEFRARIVDSSHDRLRVYLDRTAFYPTSGGQPFDTGKLAGVDVVEVVDEDDRIAHLMAGPLSDGDVDGAIDWQRRFDHMQQHTGQHLLSAVLVDLFGAQTVSFHLGAESCTIDVARLLEPGQIREAERRANQIVFENRPVTIGYQHSSEDLGLRKPTEREGVVRIISIQDLDRTACGGTHVRATGEIGPILIRKLDRIRGNQRIEFLCGMRAIKRARADYEALSNVARAFSAPLDDSPSLVAAQLEKLQDLEKAHRRLAVELAQSRGRELYSATAPGPSGVRRSFRRVAALPDDIRAEAQSFTAAEKAIFLAIAEDPPSVLLAASPDSGVHAGEILKNALAQAGGRGGGSATMAQGSVPSKESLNQVAQALAAPLGFPDQA
jgi:alanyl-tRNA synthetase